MPEQEEATVVGILTKIHVEVGPPMIAVKVPPGAEIRCYYAQSLRDQIANLMAGSLVEVTGIATRDSTGQVTQLDSIVDIAQVNTAPVRIGRIEHEGTIYRFREPLLLNVDYADGVWVYSNEEINLWGTGKRREDALRDLAENFAYLWKEIAEAPDEALDANARRLKAILLALREGMGAEHAA